MEYKTFKNIELSRLGMGNMRLPIIDGNQNQIDYQKGQEIIDYCMEHGVNYYDTAYIYHEGKSEVFLGQALSKYPRDNYYIADKLKLSSNPNYKEQFQQQLDRLGVDYIDFYLMHGISDTNVDSYLKQDCLDYFIHLKEEGKIKYLGFSFHGSIPVLKRMVQAHQWDFAQIQLNYYDWYYGSAKQQYDILTKNYIPIMVMEPIHGGMLANIEGQARNDLEALDTNQSLASWALRFVMNLDNVQVVLSGMSNLEQVIDNINTFSYEYKLNQHEQDTIKKACDEIQNNIGVLCTACRYCVAHCPKGLEIPELLKLYNEYKTSGKWRLGRLDAYDQETLPSNCISCGMCTRQCPQGIKVYEYLKEMSQDYQSIKK